MAAMLDIDEHWRRVRARMYPPVAATRIRMAGWILLALPGSFLLVAWLDGIFHFTPPAHNSQNGGDLGLLLVVWFGVGLVCRRQGYVTPAKILCAIYFVLFTALSAAGTMFDDRLHSHGVTTSLTIFVPIHSPTPWHYALLEIFAMAFFGVPFLLLKRPRFGGAMAKGGFPP